MYVFVIYCINHATDKKNTQLTNLPLHSHQDRMPYTVRTRTIKERQRGTWSMARQCVKAADKSSKKEMVSPALKQHLERDINES